MTPPAASYLGCPEWANADWRGTLFPAKSKSADFLQHYASVFNTVEGNTTFYALPRPEIILRWRELTPEGFRFCFKFPKRISHEHRLRNVRDELATVFRTFAPLAERLGPLFLQLSAAFGPSELPILNDFLQRLPPDFRYAVEVRHSAFFTGGDAETRLNDTLRTHRTARVVFDTTTLFSSTERDPDTQEAQHKKPQVPFRDTVTADFAMVRFVGELEDARNHAPLQGWADRVSGWLQQGIIPWFFVHTPGDYTAPQLARAFHQMLRHRAPALPALADFPGEHPELAEPSGQLSLF